MGTPVKNPRCIIKGFRLTEEESIQLREDMAKADYLSVSKYVRDKSLDRFIDVRHTTSRFTDRSLRNKINDISARISILGVEYNNETKYFNTLCKKTRPDGSPMINTRSANMYLIKLIKITKKLQKEVERALETVKEVEKSGRT